MSEEFYIGLMSGTSADGIDAALVAIDDAHGIRLCRALFTPFPAPLRAAILALAGGRYDGKDPIERLGELDVQLGEAFADAALALREAAGLEPRQVRAIGSHGQTIRHRPDAAPAFTLQIGDPHVIAARTGIATVADFRRRDLALGGQGAPLVPAFHQAVFAAPGETRAVLNLGGIANLTLLAADDTVTGFDTGPGNILLDAWAARHGHGRMDKDGVFARAGQPDPRLLKTLLADAYFERPPPKSTGPECFNLDWLDAALKATGTTAAPADVQATLVELTAAGVAAALTAHAAGAMRLYACGGGVHNPALMQALAVALPGIDVTTTADLNVNPDWVEAMAFAWLARQTLGGLPGNVTAVTGAREAAPLGAVVRAGGGAIRTPLPARRNHSTSH